MPRGSTSSEGATLEAWRENEVALMHALQKTTFCVAQIREENIDIMGERRLHGWTNSS